MNTEADSENRETGNRGTENVHVETLCVILVHGIVPEFMPHLAFRREKHYKTAGMKIIKCPHCGGDFKVVEATAKLELICYPREKDIKLHDAIPCQICQKEVGIIYTAA